MIDFMVIGLPRSGTTWAANWLTTRDTFCVHDPLWTIHPADIDTVVTDHAGGVMSGISCTGIWRWVDWVNRHPARKLILDRDVVDVRRSLRHCGLPVPPLNAALNLASIDGLRVPYEHLFDQVTAEPIWDYLTNGLPFDAERHAELVQMNIQPQRNRVRINADVQRRIAAEVRQ